MKTIGIPILVSIDVGEAAPAVLGGARAERHPWVVSVGKPVLALLHILAQASEYTPRAAGQRERVVYVAERVHHIAGLIPPWRLETRLVVQPCVRTGVGSVPVTRGSTKLVGLFRTYA